MIRKRENIVARVIHDSYFLIDIKQNYLDDKARIYEVNEIGYYIWKQLDVVSDVDDIVDLLSNEITEDINRNFIKKDVVEFLNALQSEKFFGGYRWWKIMKKCIWNCWILIQIRKKNG